MRVIVSQMNPETPIDPDEFFGQIRTCFGNPFKEHFELAIEVMDDDGPKLISTEINHVTLKRLLKLIEMYLDKE